jgi:argininosuccinate lyase
MISTDLVEYLVNKGVPFRKAHEDISALVAHARESGVPLNELSLSACQTFNQAFESDLFRLFDPKGSLQAKTSPGSTGTEQVKAALSKAAKI